MKRGEGVTAASGIELVRVDDQTSTEAIGPANTAKLPVGWLRPIEQVRKTYPPDEIRALAESIEVVDENDRLIRLDLQHPPTVAKLDTLGAQAYLEDHAKFYGFVEAEYVEPADDDSVYIIIAGHRRLLALQYLIEKHELNLGRTVICNIHENISFDDALALQMRENTHERVPAHQEAKHIAQYYQYLQAKSPNKRITHRTIALHTGRSDHVVGKALAFMSLPQEVRDYTEKYQILPYSTVTRLKPYQDALERYHRQMNRPAEERDEYVKREILLLSNKLAESKLTNDVKLEAIINRHIEQLKITFSQDELFVMEVCRGDGRVAASSKKLGDLAIRTLKAASRDGSTLGQDQIADLELLLATAKEAATANTPDRNQLTMFSRL